MNLEEGPGRSPDLFAIVSNTRNGSTWLATALGGIDPGIVVDLEVKVEGYARSSVHYPLSPGLVAAQFEELSRSLSAPFVTAPRAIGTKITLDPTVEPHHANSLIERFRLLSAVRTDVPHLKVIHITRDICAQNQSAGGHSPKGDPHEESPFEQSSALVRNATHEAVASARALPSDPHVCLPSTALHQSVNDICAAAALNGEGRYLHVRYESLQEDFPRILAFLNISTERTLSDLSVTKKNPRNGPTGKCDLGHHVSVLRDSLVDRLASSEHQPLLAQAIVEASGSLMQGLNRQVQDAKADATSVPGHDLLREVKRRVAAKLRIRS